MVPVHLDEVLVADLSPMIFWRILQPWQGTDLVVNFDQKVDLVLNKSHGFIEYQNLD